MFLGTGKTKSNQGWTPLHLASYFGHRDVAEVLLQNGASLDELNDAGDTPLHKAALTNREVAHQCCSFVLHQKTSYINQVKMKEGT